MKRTSFRIASYLSVLALVAVVSGCRAFNSDYSASPELQEMLSKPVPSASDNKPKPDPAVSAAAVDYSKDSTVCETPADVTVGKITGSIISSWGWAVPSKDGETAAVSAVKKGPNSAAITVKKEDASGIASTLSFTVKQTAADKFSVCDFNYSIGERRLSKVSGSVTVKLVNAVNEKAGTIVNSGAFNLTFGTGADASKVQSIFLGGKASSAVDAGTVLDGIYFIDDTADAAE